MANMQDQAHFRQGGIYFVKLTEKVRKCVIVGNMPPANVLTSELKIYEWWCWTLFLLLFNISQTK